MFPFRIARRGFGLYPSFRSDDPRDPGGMTSDVTLLTCNNTHSGFILWHNNTLFPLCLSLFIVDWWGPVTGRSAKSMAQGPFNLILSCTDVVMEEFTVSGTTKVAFPPPSGSNCSTACVFCPCCYKSCMTRLQKVICPPLEGRTGGKERKDSAGSDDTASMIKGGGY